MVNNLPADYAKTVVYPAYREMLDTASKGKKWTWCEVCPDAIVSLVHDYATYVYSIINVNSDRVHPQWFSVQLSTTLGPVFVPVCLQSWDWTTHTNHEGHG